MPRVEREVEDEVEDWVQDEVVDEVGVRPTSGIGDGVVATHPARRMLPHGAPQWGCAGCVCG